MKQIRVFRNEHGVCYRGTRDQLINAGLATRDMFPGRHEAWRGNGLFRESDELLWSVQRTTVHEYIVMWGICVEEEAD
ncbi:MAG: hypothetical protein IT495_09240 [Gammaproteobacteria bacterium]|nr:hypothetical protein [Gammaproteobacteria bacterium]